MLAANAAISFLLAPFIIRATGKCGDGVSVWTGRPLKKPGAGMSKHTQ